MVVEITKQQMQCLATDGLTRRIIATLAETFPADIGAEDPQALAATVRDQVAIAGQYGFASEYAVATFVATAWLLGLGFDRKIPAVAECLARGDMSEEDKALWLEQFSALLFSTLAEA